MSETATLDRLIEACRKVMGRCVELGDGRFVISKDSLVQFHDTVAEYLTPAQKYGVCSCWLSDNTLPENRCRNCGKWCDIAARTPSAPAEPETGKVDLSLAKPGDKCLRRDRGMMVFQGQNESGEFAKSHPYKASNESYRRDGTWSSCIGAQDAYDIIRVTRNGIQITPAAPRPASADAGETEAKDWLRTPKCVNCGYPTTNYEAACDPCLQRQSGLEAVNGPEITEAFRSNHVSVFQLGRYEVVVYGDGADWIWQSSDVTANEQTDKGVVCTFGRRKVHYRRHCEEAAKAWLRLQFASPDRRVPSDEREPPKPPVLTAAPDEINENLLNTSLPALQVNRATYAIKLLKGIREDFGTNPRDFIVAALEGLAAEVAALKEELDSQ